MKSTLTAGADVEANCSRGQMLSSVSVFLKLCFWNDEASNEKEGEKKKLTHCVYRVCNLGLKVGNIHLICETRSSSWFGSCSSAPADFNYICVWSKVWVSSCVRRKCLFVLWTSIVSCKRIEILNVLVQGCANICRMMLWFWCARLLSLAAPLWCGSEMARRLISWQSRSSVSIFIKYRHGKNLIKCSWNHLAHA